MLVEEENCTAGDLKGTRTVFTMCWMPNNSELKLKKKLQKEK